jgi:hypothetical protein
MPWYGDQFEYTHAYIQAIIENYLPLREAALNDPYSNPAILIYDIDIALEGAGLTPRQAEAIYLRMAAKGELEMEADMSMSQQAVNRVLHRAYGRLRRHFAQGGCKNPAAGANT